MLLTQRNSVTFTTQLNTAASRMSGLTGPFLFHRDDFTFSSEVSGEWESDISVVKEKQLTSSLLSPESLSFPAPDCQGQVSPIKLLSRHGRERPKAKGNKLERSLLVKHGTEFTLRLEDQ